MSGKFDVTLLSTTSLRKGTKTTSLNTNYTDSFIQNDLISSRYETTPIQGANSRMPGYAGFVPEASPATGATSLYAPSRCSRDCRVCVLRAAGVARALRL